MFEKIKDSIIRILTSRLTVMVIIALLLGGALIYRLFQLQIVRGEEFLNDFILESKKTKEVTAARGNIYDRNGQLLAYNELAYSVKIEDVYETGRSKNRLLNANIYKLIKLIEKNGDTEKEVESKIFPCYVLIKMVMTEESWHAVRNITGVTGFVGPGSRPTPLTEEEVEALNIDGKSRVELLVKVGDNVVVNSGLFEGYTGTVEAISDDQKTITVLIKRGRRDMPVELDASVVKLA